MRNITKLGAVMALALAASACSSTGPTNGESESGGNAPEGTGKTQTLSVWGWRADEPFQELVNSFVGPNGEKIEYTAYKAEEYNTILKTGLSSSSGPDAMMLRSYGGLDTLVAGGEVAALADDDSALAAIPANLVDGMRSHADGAVYGVPFASVTANVLYNKTVLDELGLSEPTTWQEFEALNQSILDAGYSSLAAGALDSWVLPIYRDLFGAAAYDGPVLAEELLSGAQTFESPDYAAANQVLLDLAKYLPAGYEGLSYEDAKAMFSSGQALLYPGGIWELATFRDTVTDFELGLFEVPRSVGGGEPYAMGYLDGGFGISSKLDDDKSDLAHAFLDWVGSVEFGQGVADLLMSIPAVDGVTPSDPVLARANEAFHSNPTPYLTYEYFDYGTPSGTSLEYDYLQKMLLGTMTPEEVGVQVQAGISQWFTPEK